MTSPERDDEVALWASSGAMAITGLRHGGPLVSTGSPATAVAAALRDLATATEQRIGRRPDLPGVGILGERAAVTGLGRNGPRSIGGPFRILRTADGHLGICLPRVSDLQSVPAIIGQSTAADPWVALKTWAATQTTGDAVERCRLLDLAAAAIPEAPSGPKLEALSPVREHVGVSRRQVERPRIIDFSSLWAGPLCAHLLGLGEAEVIKVESTDRPDGSRLRNPRFYDLLHEGHASVTFDFTNPAEVARMNEFVKTGDVVIEASRPRALSRLGIIASDHVAAGTIWLSITARGRSSNTIGFGDDVSSDAGLLAWDGEQPVPAGDAIADPMTGVTAAAAISRALLSQTSKLIEVSMFDVAAAACSRAPGEHRIVKKDRSWMVESVSGCHVVQEPRQRYAAGAASASGANNAEFRR